MRKSSETIESALQSAALRVHFGEAESEPEPPILQFPGVIDESVERNAQPNPSHGILWSVAIHGLLFLILAFVVTDAGDQLALFLERDAISASFADRDVLDDQPHLPSGAAIMLKQSSGPAAKKSTFVSSITQLNEDGPEVAISPEEFTPAFGDEGESETGHGRGGVEQFRFQKPNNGRAVTKGSFTVWTEPLDPIPNQPYMIVVQLRVPEGMATFPKSDLRIDVVGTDTFHLKLPDPRRGFKLVGELPVINGQTQLIIPIPGAPSLVRDAIRIQSMKVLREKQSMVIEF